MNQALIEVSDLRKVYGGRGFAGTGIGRSAEHEVVAIDHLDLELCRPGFVHGFLGPNGSGKTTTIRCLLGLIQPTAGSVRVFGVDSSREFHRAAPRVGAIVESPKLFPKFSAQRNLQLLADIAGIPKSETDRVLRIVGLDRRSRDSFESYSLGMRQRLAIAAALLKSPELLILDEPANGLDPAGIAEIRVLIRTIAAEGKAVLVSSHQLAEIEHICDDVTIIDQGRLVIEGTLDEVRSRAGGDVVVVTIDDRDGALAVLREDGIVAHPQPEPDDLVVEVAPERAGEVTESLAKRGRYLRGLHTHRATLEAAFLHLTGAPPPPTGPPTDVGGRMPPVASGQHDASTLDTTAGDAS